MPRPAGGSCHQPAYASFTCRRPSCPPARVTVARGGTPQLMNMGTAPVRLAVTGTNVVATVDANASGERPLAGLRAGHYTLQAQRPDGRPTALQLAITIAGSSTR